MILTYKILTWDYKDSPPWGKLTMAIQTMKEPHILGVETESDENAIVVTDGVCLDTTAQKLYNLSVEGIIPDAGTFDDHPLTYAI